MVRSGQSSGIEAVRSRSSLTKKGSPSHASWGRDGFEASAPTLDMISARRGQQIPSSRACVPRSVFRFDVAGYPEHTRRMTADVQFSASSALWVLLAIVALGSLASWFWVARSRNARGPSARPAVFSLFADVTENALPSGWSDEQIIVIIGDVRMDLRDRCWSSWSDPSDLPPHRGCTPARFSGHASRLQREHCSRETANRHRTRRRARAGGSGMGAPRRS